MSNSKWLIIDADSWAYGIAHFNNLTESEAFEAIDSEDEAEFEGSVKNWAQDAIKREVERWCNLTGCSNYQLHLSVGQEKLSEVFRMQTGNAPKPNFRYAVAEALTHSYKHNRPSDSLPGAEYVLDTMATNFNSFMHDEWEADDAVVALKRKFRDDIILCAIDKDVLNQVEGVHFNYRKLEPVVTDATTVIKYPYWQALTGDPGDGYKGVPGVGKKKADTLLDEITYTNDDEYREKLWRAVASMYKIKGMSYSEAVATMQLACMNQLAITGTIENPKYELNLWTPPVNLEW